MLTLPRHSGVGWNCKIILAIVAHGNDVVRPSLLQRWPWSQYQITVYALCFRKWLIGPVLAWNLSTSYMLDAGVQMAPWKRKQLLPSICKCHGSSYTPLSMRLQQSGSLYLWQGSTTGTFCASHSHESVQRTFQAVFKTFELASNATSLSPHDSIPLWKLFRQPFTWHGTNVPGQ